MELNLFSNQLSGEIPPELGSFTSLTSLLLNDSQLSFLPGGCSSARQAQARPDLNRAETSRGVPRAFQ